MNLHKNDWLRLLAARPHPGHPAEPGLRLATLRRARGLLSTRLRDGGLLYGTPLLPAELAPGQPPRERLFLAVHAGLLRLGHELADALGRPAVRRDADLAAAFLAYAGEPEAAQRLADAERPNPAAVAKAFAKAAAVLAERLERLTADPVYGVPLHNGLNYVDAWTFGRIALALFASGAVNADTNARRLADGSRHKAALVEALVELVWAAGPPSLPVRRALSRQMGGLGLPRAATRALRAALDRPGTPQGLAEKVRRREHRRFVLAQAVLASLVDGRRSPAEQRYLDELARAFGFEPNALKALEVELAAFYAEHREFVDTFTASEAGLELADEVVDELSRKVEQNLAKVMVELRQTGELAELLGKAARGASLGPEEKAQLRQSLLDLAKAVPSLAILAAPGGLLLLAALTKVLPFNILPSAWDEPEARKRSAR